MYFRVQNYKLFHRIRWGDCNRMVLVVFSLLYFLGSCIFRNYGWGPQFMKQRSLVRISPSSSLIPIVSQESFCLTTLPSPKLPLLSGVQHVGVYIYFFIGGKVETRFEPKTSCSDTMINDWLSQKLRKWWIKFFNQTLPLGHNLQKKKMLNLQLEKKVFQDSI